MACLDTTLLIDLGRRASPRKEQAARKIEELTAKGQTIVTTRFNVAELYVGISSVPSAGGGRKGRPDSTASIRDFGVH